MEEEKQKIIASICYTELVYERINKKLSANFSKKEIESLLKYILTNTDKKFFKQSGKNYYVRNAAHEISITINSNTYSVITVDKINNPLKKYKLDHM